MLHHVQLQFESLFAKCLISSKDALWLVYLPALLIHSGQVLIFRPNLRYLPSPLPDVPAFHRFSLLLPESANPDIYTQLFQDNTALNNSYPNIDQEFANLPDVDELIEQSELDQENDYEHYQWKKKGFEDFILKPLAVLKRQLER